jgi:hypothetical protein
MFMRGRILSRDPARDEHNYFLIANDQTSILRPLEVSLPSGNRECAIENLSLAIQPTESRIIALAQSGNRVTFPPLIWQGQGGHDTAASRESEE